MTATEKAVKSTTVLSYSITLEPTFRSIRTFVQFTELEEGGGGGGGANERAREHIHKLTHTNSSLSAERTRPRTVVFCPTDPLPAKNGTMEVKHLPTN